MVLGSITLLLQQPLQHVQMWHPHAWVSKWIKTGFLCHFNRQSLWQITRRNGREMSENEISSGSSKAALLCGNFIRCSLTTKTVQQVSSGSTRSLSHSKFPAPCNHRYIHKSIHTITKKNPSTPTTSKLFFALRRGCKRLNENANT